MDRSDSLDDHVDEEDNSRALTELIKLNLSNEILSAK